MNASLLAREESKAKMLFGALYLLISLVGTVMWFEFTSLHDDMDGLGHAMGLVRVDYASLSKHVIDHEQEKRIWVARILENAADLKRMQRDPSARADSFSGTQGRVLEKRIRALENPAKGKH